MMGIFEMLDSKVLGRALLESMLAKGKTKEQLVEELADQLDVIVLTGRYANECIAARDQELNRSMEIETAKRTIEELRERNAMLLRDIERSGARSVALTNGMIVDTPQGKARVLIVDAAA
jgi:3-phosphoglycerate kinase